MLLPPLATQIKKPYTPALARWLGWLEYFPIHQEVEGSIPSQGT